MFSKFQDPPVGKCCTLPRRMFLLIKSTLNNAFQAIAV